MVSIAGFRFFRHPVEHVSLKFRDEKGDIVTINTHADVLVPTRIDRKMLDDVKHIPSILGNNFLEEHKFTLVFNPSSQTAFLEQDSLYQNAAQGPTLDRKNQGPST